MSAFDPKRTWQWFRREANQLVSAPFRSVSSVSYVDRVTDRGCLALTTEMHSNMQVEFVTVDVFTDRQFGGNPLAVVSERL